jgi:hypothetical protein
VAGCATPTGSAGHAGATANLKLTFHLDHSAGADQRFLTAISFEVLDHADVRVELALNDKALIIQTDPLSANRITLVAADRH